MGNKMLIVYYSVSNGNTQMIAEKLQKATGADIAKIETAALSVLFTAIAYYIKKLLLNVSGRRNAQNENKNN